MKKTGFTLIELLAVIVILAIIALIAVPIVIHIIDDAKTSSGEETVKLYMDTVKKAITRKQLEMSNFNPSICTIKNNGNLLCDEKEIIVDMKGIKPNKGIIEISKNKVIYKNLLLNGTYYHEKGILVDDADDNNTISMGDKYTYKVNDRDKFNFYVLSINSDNTINLIMDRNLCNDGTVEYTSKNNYCRYYWYSPNRDNTYGPVTAMQEIYKGTKNWDNVPVIELNYKDEGNTGSEENGYTSVVISDGVATITGKPTTKETTIGTTSQPLKARLPKMSEIIGAGCVGVNGTCPVWLMENMTYSNVSNDKYLINNNNESYQNNILGYWVLSSRSGNFQAHVVWNPGRWFYFYTTRGHYGVRPVITVPITDLSN